MNIYRVLYSPAMWLSILIFIVSACIADMTDSAGTSSNLPLQEKVIIDLQLPQSGVPLTRTVASDSLTATRSQEGAVKDVYVLSFGTETEEPFLYYVKAVQQEDSFWEATLQLLEGRKQSFVVIANVDNQKGDLKQQLESLLDVAENKNQPKSTLLRKLYVGDGKPLVATDTAPLCGQTDATSIYSGSGQKLSVKLHRMTSSLSLYVGDKEGNGINGFELTSINLCNMQGKGSVVPLELSRGFEGPVKNATLPQTVKDGVNDTPVETPFSFNVTGNIVENQIYFFEGEQPESDDKKRPCIVIGGTWNSKPGFWRIDFKTDPHDKNTYVDLLRNHNYSLTLVNVRSDGAENIESALAKSENDLDVDIIVMDDYSISNVAFDGSNFLGIQHKNYTVNRHGINNTTELNEFIQEVIAKDGLDWHAQLISSDVNTQGLDWISFSNEEDLLETGGTGSGTSTTNLKFYVDEWNDPSPGETRTAIMRFTAGNLLVEATVTQTDEYMVNLEMTSEKELIINADGTVTNPVEVKFGPAGATLEWALIKGGGVEPQSGVTGQATAISAEETVKIGTDATVITAADLNAQTDLLYADYETSMMVVVRMDNAVKSLVIPVKQTKLGLELLDADGEYQPMADYMTFNTNSNFKWKVSIIGAPPGHFVKGVDPNNNSGEGQYPESRNADFSLLTHNLSNDIDGENTGEVTLRFKDDNSDFYVDKVIKFRSGLTINGQAMKIVGPVWRTPNDLTNLVDYNGVSYGGYGKWPDERVAQFISKKLGNNECVMYQKPGISEGAYIPNSIYNDRDSRADKNRRWVAIPAPNSGKKQVGFFVDTYKNGVYYLDPIWTINVSSTYSWKKISWFPWQTVDATNANYSVTFPKETTKEYLSEQFLTYGLFVDGRYDPFKSGHPAFGGKNPDYVRRWDYDDYVTMVYDKLTLYRYSKESLPANKTNRQLNSYWTGHADWYFNLYIEYNHPYVTPYQAAESRRYKTFYLLPREDGESSGVENIK